MEKNVTKKTEKRLKILVEYLETQISVKKFALSLLKKIEY